MLLLKQGNKLEIGGWEEFLKLESHIEAWESRGGETWANICLMAKGAKEYSETDIGEEAMRDIVCKVCWSRSIKGVLLISSSSW
jgi:hypothetical protein